MVFRERRRKSTGGTREEAVIRELGLGSHDLGRRNGAAKAEGVVIAEWGVRADGFAIRLALDDHPEIGCVDFQKFRNTRELGFSRIADRDAR